MKQKTLAEMEQTTKYLLKMLKGLGFKKEERWTEAVEDGEDVRFTKYVTYGIGVVVQELYDKD